MEIVSWGGWDRCARLVSGETEIIVTLEVGPRIVRYGRIGGPNHMRENPEEMGLKGGSEYRSYGGHRLWIAPEDFRRTYQSENDPVDYAVEGDVHKFGIKPDVYGLQKEIWIKAIPTGFAVGHRVTNTSPYALAFAPWSLTVMAPGGECIFPQEPFQPHSENFLPVRPLVLWSYTDMADPRWTWGTRTVRLRQTTNSQPQKVGTLVKAGCVAYANHGECFFKRFPYEEGAPYADFGCNFETFTRHDMLEVESVGPLRSVETGETAWLLESWSLLPETPPTGDAEAAEWLIARAAERPLTW